MDILDDMGVSKLSFSSYLYLYLVIIILFIIQTFLSKMCSI